MTEVFYPALKYNASINRKCLGCGGEVKIQRIGENVFNRCIRCKALTTIH